MDDDNSQDPKPMVTFAYLPKEDSEQDKPDILDKIISDYQNKKDIPFQFGANKNILNDEIKKKINEFHKVKTEQEKPSIEEDDEELIGPPIPKNLNQRKSSEDSNDSQTEKQYSKIPMTHIVELTHTKQKSLNTLDIDRGANLLATGSYDGTVKIWDFNALTRRPEATHTIDCGSDGEYPVISVSWAPSGGFLLVCSGDCQAKVLSRNGENEISCLKGDSYLHDITNTKGHTFPLTDGKWHPIERNIFITSSRDSTIRIWDIYSKQMGIDLEIMQSTILRAKTFKNHKIPVTSCNYSNDGKMIIGGVNDGSIQIWTNKNWKPEIYIPNAHSNNAEITSVLFHEENSTFYSRADDNTMKIWDIRRTDRPVHVFSDLPCFNSKTGICLSPENDIIITGTSVRKGNDFSHLYFYSSFDYHLIKKVQISQSSITSLLWNQKINQICAGSLDGICRIYFNPEISKNGIINSIYKKSKMKETDDFEYAQPIITPLVLPLFDEVNFSRETYLEKINGVDNSNKQSADIPLSGQYRKYARPASVTQHIMQNINKALYGEGDSQKVLLKFAKEDKGDGMWVDRAYKETQPKPVLNYNANLEDEVKFYEQSTKKRCPQCGLKFCTCKKNIFQLPLSKLTIKPKK